MKSMTKGALIATAVAGLFLANATMAIAGEEKAEGKVKCSGANACKGHGACAGAGHDCGGKNECKGKGFLKVSSEKECTDKGGKVEK